MTQYRLTHCAERDILHAAAYYRELSDDLAARFLLDVDATIAAVVERPSSFPRYNQRTRRARTHVFKYGIFFRLERETLVVIMSVYHPSRDPTKWRGRG